MIDMKMTKKDSPHAVEPAASSGSGPRYPYGLELDLEKETIEKLGLNFDRLKIGQTVKIVAEAEVSSLSERESNDGDRRSISLQIVRMNKPIIQRKDRMKEGTKLLNNMRNKT